MSDQLAIDYLRNQAYWILRMADQMEKGDPVDCKWAVDLEIPKFDKYGVKEVSV